MNPDALEYVQQATNLGTATYEPPKVAVIEAVDDPEHKNDEV